MNGDRRGFALIITLALLGLVVLVALALASLAKVSSEVASLSASQTRARQNALLGLRIALGELQRTTGDAAGDENLTGMAGIAGVQANSRFRQWCGVWNGASGELVTWLSSGSTDGPIPAVKAGVAPITLVGSNSVGTITNAEDREPVDVGRESILVAVANSAPAPSGGYAYWVGDEGIKISLYPQPARAAAVVVDPLPLFGGASIDAAAMQNVLILEQAKFLPPGTTSLNATVRYQLFHNLTVNHMSLPALGGGAFPVDGKLNINTTSAKVWSEVFNTYNSTKSAADPSITNVAISAQRMRDEIARTEATGKSRERPFQSVAAFANSGILPLVLGSGANSPAARIMDVMEAALAVRSDTFRIRAYGDAMNLADPTRIEAVAYCEAIVQRREFPPPEGRKYVITYFRWLGPDDI